MISQNASAPSHEDSSSRPSPAITGSYGRHLPTSPSSAIGVVSSTSGEVSSSSGVVGSSSALEDVSSPAMSLSSPPLLRPSVISRIEPSAITVQPTMMAPIRA